MTVWKAVFWTSDMRAMPLCSNTKDGDFDLCLFDT